MTLHIIRRRNWNSIGTPVEFLREGPLSLIVSAVRLPGYGGSAVFSKWPSRLKEDFLEDENFQSLVKPAWTIGNFINTRHPASDIRMHGHSNALMLKRIDIQIYGQHQQQWVRRVGKERRESTNQSNSNKQGASFSTHKKEFQKLIRLHW